MNAVRTPDTSVTPAGRRGAKLGWRRVNQPAFLEALQQDQQISPEFAARADKLYRKEGVHVLPGLLRLSAIAEAPLYRSFALHAQVRLIDDSSTDLASLSAQARAGADKLGLATDWLSLKGALVFEEAGAWCAAFREEPSDELVELVDRKSRQLGVSFGWALMPPSIYDHVARAQRETRDTVTGGDDLRALRELAEEGPTIELVNGILSQAVTQRASDVHIEPEEAEFFVRVRVDGDMLLQTRQPRDRFDAVACRIKILSNLDIAERRLPQDGRINARVNGESFDIRVSVLPGSLGESIVLRLLRQERKPTRLEDLGMDLHQAAAFEAWARLANGIVLVTGPTGSGKSTTLYTALELANDRTKKIITVEDPVEYKIRGITQLQVNADIGFTFAAALRSILRHDPDIILVGEIRDEETARIAIQSSLTGHMVLSTLHTNSAVGAITRLIDMGIEPFLIAASVRGLMAQRLVRRLCPHCAVPDTDPDEATDTLIRRWQHSHPGQPLTLNRAVGCSHCSGTGYFGRFAIYDLIEVSREMAHAITQNVSEAQLLALVGQAEESGLLHSGVDHVAHGNTTLAEVLRATGGA